VNKRKLLLSGAACAALVALLATGLGVRRSRANESRDIAPDTVITPLANGAFNNRVIAVKDQRYFYKVFLPHDYTPDEKWPVIFALHGGRTRGVENVVQAREGIANVVREQAATFPAIVIFPQVPTRARGHEFIAVDLAMIDAEMKALNGDRDRLYLTGSSFGGFTAFQMAFMYPERFAALVPVATGIDLSVVRGGARSGHDSVYSAVARRIKNGSRVDLSRGAGRRARREGRATDCPDLQRDRSGCPLHGVREVAAQHLHAPVANARVASLAPRPETAPLAVAAISLRARDAFQKSPSQVDDEWARSYRRYETRVRGGPRSPRSGRPSRSSHSRPRRAAAPLHENR
jgi:pimeloyl-ACP methyl ester carboxylesterase